MCQRYSLPSTFYWRHHNYGDRYDKTVSMNTNLFLWFAFLMPDMTWRVSCKNQRLLTHSVHHIPIKIWYDCQCDNDPSNIERENINYTWIKMIFKIKYYISQYMVAKLNYILSSIEIKAVIEPSQKKHEKSLNKWCAK